MAVDKIVLQYEADIRDLKAKMSEIETSFGKQEATLKKVNSEVTNVSKNIGGGLGGALSKIQPMIAATFSVGAVYAFAKAAIQGAANMETLRVSFTTMLGSAEKAEVLLKKITAFAASTPFELPEVTEASKKLLAFGVSAENVIPALKNVGDVAAGVGAPIGEIAELYGKAKTQGRLFAEDVNQLTGRGIPIIQELAKQFGVTENKVKSLVESGSVNFENLEQAFASLSGEGGKFFNLMEAQSKTTAGMWSNLKDTAGQLLTAIGTSILPILKGAMDGIMALVRESAPLADAFAMAAEPVRDLGNTLSEIIEQSGLFTEKTESAKFTMQALGYAVKIATMPFKLLIETVVLTIDSWRVLVNEAKKAANFFGAEFKIDPKIGVEKLVTDVKKIGQTLASPLEFTKKAAEKTATEIEEIRKKSVSKFTVELSASEKKAIEKKEKLLAEEKARQKRIQEGNIETVDVALSKVSNDVSNMPEGISAKKLADLQVDVNAKAEEKKTEKAKEEAEKRKKLEEEVISQSINLMNLGFELNKTINEAELTDLESKKEKGLITEKEYNRQVAEIKLKQAKADRTQALFNIGIQTALNAVKAFPNPLLIALAIAQGALQAAAVLARPLPEVPAFAKGGWVNGKKQFIQVNEEGEEFVVNAKSANARPEYVQELNKSPEAFDKLIAHKMVAPALKRYEQNRQRSTAENMFKSMKLQAQFNDRNIVNAVRGNKNVELGSATVNNLAKKLRPTYQKDIF